MIGPTPIYDSSSTFFYNDSYSFVMKCYADEIVECKANTIQDVPPVCKDNGNREKNDLKN